MGNHKGRYNGSASGLPSLHCNCTGQSHIGMSHHRAKRGSPVNSNNNEEEKVRHFSAQPSFRVCHGPHGLERKLFSACKILLLSIVPKTNVSFVTSFTLRVSCSAPLKMPPHGSVSFTTKKQSNGEKRPRIASSSLLRA